MPSVPKSFPWTDAAGPDLLQQATAVLAREVSRLPGGLGGYSKPEASAPTQALSNAPSLGHGAAAPDLGKQAHELLAAVLSLMGSPALPRQPALPNAAECPVTKASLVPAGLDKDSIRRQAHEFIDTLLLTFRDVTGEDGVVADNRVPLVHAAGPTPAGSVARAHLRIVNEDASPAEVTLYCSNFVADTGYEIPALRVSSTPRSTLIPAGGQASFEIKIAVPPQAPAGTYSGLIQAMGSKYVKAVLSVQVL